MQHSQGEAYSLLEVRSYIKHVVLRGRGGHGRGGTYVWLDSRGFFLMYACMCM